MTPHLIRFMQDIEHYNPLFTYRRGILQKAPDSLYRMPGLKEEGKPADTERFYTIYDLLAAEDEDIDAEQLPPDRESSNPSRHPRKIEDYKRLRKYLKASAVKDNADDHLKQDSSYYELRDGILHHSGSDTPVVITPEHLRSVIELVHKDLGHYGKRTTLDAVRQRYIVASDLWEEGEKGVGLMHTLSIVQTCAKDGRHCDNPPLQHQESIWTMGNPLRWTPGQDLRWQSVHHHGYRVRHRYRNRLGHPRTFCCCRCRALRKHCLDVWKTCGNHLRQRRRIQISGIPSGAQTQCSELYINSAHQTVTSSKTSLIALGCA